MEEALDAYRRARAVRPDYGAALCGEALTLRNLGRYSEALAAFEAAEALGSGEAVAGKGCLLLTLGDFERGFEGYEARWLAGKSLGEALGTRYPTWAGPGRGQDRVLVLNDHGLGDTIQFVRYLPRMAAEGVAATFVCPPKLFRLLHPTIPARLLESPPEAPFDAQIAISSLPRAFRTRLDTVPADVPYLAADPAALSQVGRADRGGRVQDRHRLAGQLPSRGGSGALLPARHGGAAGVACRRPARLVAKRLWRRAGRQTSARDAGRDARRGLDSGPDAFVDTAAAMMHCDLVVTCDTSIAHLAGALARPVVGRAEERRGMALDDRARRFALVSDDAAFPPAAARRVGRGVRGDGARRCRRRSPRAARRSSARPVRSAT